MLVTRLAIFPEIALIVVSHAGMVGHRLLLQRAFHLADAIFQSKAAFKPQPVTNLVEGNPIVAQIGVVHGFDPCIGKLRPNAFGNTGQCVVQTSVANVENLAADHGQRRLNGLQYGFGDVADMQKRPPLLSVEDGDDTFFKRLGSE